MSDPSQNERYRWRLYIFVFVMVAVLAFVVHLSTGLSLGLTFLLMILGCLGNGIFILCGEWIAHRRRNARID